MSGNPSVGIVLAIEDSPKSRRTVTAATGPVGTQRITLMPGVLGTDEGLEVVRRASDLRTSVYAETRRKGTPRKDA